MTVLQDSYPLYLNNKAVQPNLDLAVTDKFTGKVAFRTALATPDIIDEAIAGTVRAAAPFAAMAAFERQAVLDHCVKALSRAFRRAGLGIVHRGGQAAGRCRG